MDATHTLTVSEIFLQIREVITALAMVVHIFIFTVSYFQKNTYSPKCLFLSSLEQRHLKQRQSIAHTME